jgi:hypothetical protein
MISNSCGILNLSYWHSLPNVAFDLLDKHDAKAKNKDAGVFTMVGGKEFKWLGTQLEVGFHNSSKDIKRDISLGLDYSKCQVYLIPIILLM